MSETDLSRFWAATGTPSRSRSWLESCLAPPRTGIDESAYLDRDEKAELWPHAFSLRDPSRQLDARSHRAWLHQAGSAR